MQRSTGGNRRVMPGCLTVAELLERHYGVAPEPGAQSGEAGGTGEATGADEATEAPAQQHEGREGKVATASRAAGMGLATLALVSALGAASIIAGQHRSASPTVVTPQPSTAGDFTWPSALAEGTGPSHGNAATQGATTGAAKTDTRRSDQQRQATGEGVPPSASTTGIPHGDNPTGQANERGTPKAPDGAAEPAHTFAGTTDSSTADAANAVTRFYRMLQRRPDSSARLLDPGLLGSGLPALLGSPLRASTLHVDKVTARSADTVEALVTVTKADGTVLKVRQLVTMTSGVVPLIEHVTMLSANHG